jgi:hypothetical protein
MDSIEKKLDGIIERQLTYMEDMGEVREQIKVLAENVHDFKEFADEIKSYYIDRQEHYRQHEWLSEMIKYCEQCKSIIMKTIVTALIGATLAIMWIGFSLKVK